MPNTQFGFRKGLGTTNTLLLLIHDMQSYLYKPTESRIVSFKFSFALNLANHHGLLHKIKSMGIGGAVLNIFKDFLTNRYQRILV